MTTADPYSRFEYRRLIAWPERIRRETPFFERVFAGVPERRLLDLGCGSGEHARFFAENGWDVLGVDSSPAMIDQARDVSSRATFLISDLTDLERLEGSFGAAICLGNTLPHLTSRESLAAFARGLAARLASGGVAVIQLLNYDRILTTKQRSLPVNLRPDPEDGGEIVFLRLMTPHDDGRVEFFPASLVLRPERDPPLELVASRRVELYGWRREPLEAALSASGFVAIEAFGGFDGAAYDPKASSDLILVAKR